MPSHIKKTAATDEEVRKVLVRSLSGSNIRKAKPLYTGRKIVMLNQQATSVQIEKQAGKMSLKMANSRDFAASHAMTTEALDQADGIVFDKLKIAVINADNNEKLARLSEINNSHFRSYEPERYVYALQAKAAKPAPANFKDNKQATWGIQAVNALNSSYTGKGVKIAILDTGCNLSHPDFKDRIKGSKSFIKGEVVNDKNGHGSHCTGIAAGGLSISNKYRYGVASEADIYIAKVLSNAGEGEDSFILAGIEWALENDCRVISMSLGSAVEEGETYYESYESAAQTAMDYNCLLIAAAGNESDRTEGVIAPVGHPANCPSIMAVGSLDHRLKVSYFSCGSGTGKGGKIDVAGPGEEIISSWKDGRIRYRKESGTSMAAPFIAGLAALLCEAYPKASAHKIWTKLMQDAQRLQLPSSDIGAGLGHAH